MTTPAVPICDTFDVVKDELTDEILHAMAAQPRSQQKRIGPSELGMECTRRLIHKLAGHDEPEGAPPWLPYIGTAMHAQLADWFTTGAVGAMQWEPPNQRYLVEQTVTVGDVNGEPITGSADLYDQLARWVIDWKIVGDSRLKLYRAKGPGQQYRTQVHLYCRGFANAGHQPQGGIIAFLPRNGALSGAYFWHEPYDESVAVQALSRATGLAQLIDLFGVDAVLERYPACKDEWCPWCPTRRPYGAPKSVASTTAELFQLSA